MRIPTPPGWIIGQFMEAVPGPVADIDLVDVGGDIDRQMKAIREDISRLHGARLRARLNDRGRRLETSGTSRHGGAAVVVELDAGHAPAQDAAQQSMVAMTDEMNGGRHRRSFAAWRRQFLASMKARVR
jgi:hypothetical protein